MVYATHSGIRFLVLLAGFVVILYGLWGILGKRPYEPLMARLASAFTGLLHLQILIGFAVLLTRPFSSQLIGHILMTVLAAVVAQGTTSVVRKRPDDQKTYAPHVVGALLALGLIAGGIMAIGRGVFQSTI
ncbi:MAG: hypothetical protein HKN73_21125 [Gemmatimonadetes bacterium]|nr:hypothetical protein [Gemmatimonadota bacterium]